MKTNQNLKGGTNAGGSRKAHAPAKKHPWKRPAVQGVTLKSCEGYKQLVLKKYPLAYLEEQSVHVDFEIRVPIMNHGALQGYHVLCRGVSEKFAWYNAAQLIVEKEKKHVNTEISR
jgi:hypothetical protein